MSALRIATQGLLASPLSIATQGFQPLGGGVIVGPGGGGRQRPSETRRDRLREDDELILLMFAQAIASGSIH